MKLFKKLANAQVRDVLWVILIKIVIAITFIIIFVELALTHWPVIFRTFAELLGILDSSQTKIGT